MMKSDETLRQALIEKVRQQGEPDPAQRRGPVVSLEDFFTGNNDLGSIGCNLLVHPGMATFYRILQEVRNCSEVQDVLIGITDLEDTEGVWPFSDSVYILTRVPARKVARWLRRLHPDEVADAPAASPPERLPDLLPDHAVLLAWWD
jgi:hypothetical protein